MRKLADNYEAVYALLAGGTPLAPGPLDTPGRRSRPRTPAPLALR